MMISRKLERNWKIFLLVLLMTSVGLLTGFDESLEIQLHDTYYVIDILQLGVLIGLLLMTAYFLSYRLKLLAVTKKKMKAISMLTTGLIALTLIILTITITVSLYTAANSLQDLSSFGMIFLTFGLGIHFAGRTIEILKKN